MTRLLKQNIKIPFPNPAPEEKNVKYMFGFEKPTAVHLIGSYPLRTGIRKREGFSVDVGVVMPRVSIRREFLALFCGFISSF